MFVRELYIYIKREVKEMRFQIITTIVFTLSMAFFVLLLGMFINDQFKKIVIYEDFYFPHQLTTLSSPIYNLSVVSTHLVCNSSSNSSSNKSMDLKDFLSPKDLWHAMNDEELMWRASMVSQIMEYPFNRTPKVAFLFLTRGRLPLAPLWEMFFKGHEELFSIYLHTSPEFNFEPPPTSVFYKRRIPSQVQILFFFRQFFLIILFFTYYILGSYTTSWSDSLFTFLAGIHRLYMVTHTYW